MQGTGLRDAGRAEMTSGNPYANEDKIQVKPPHPPGAVGELRDARGRRAGQRRPRDPHRAGDAVLHFHLPTDAREAQRLLNRYRAMLAIDPES